MQPEVLLDMLNQLFLLLNKLAAYHGAQTASLLIDGCYIATANLSSYQATDHCTRLARFAIDAVEVAECTLVNVGRPKLAGSASERGCTSALCLCA